LVIKARFSSLIFSLILLMFSILGCEEKNLFEGSGGKTSQEAILLEAEVALNAGEYDRALLLFDSLRPSVQAEKGVALKMASAHAGLCGVDFLRLADEFGGAAADSIMPTLFLAFPNSNLDSYSSCQEAEAILRAIGDETIRSVDENLLLILNALSEIGNILNIAADQNSDSIVDTSFDHCSKTQLPDALVDQLGAAIALTLNTLAVVGEDIVDISALQDQCNTFPGFSRVCTSESGGFNVNELRAIRAFIGSSDFGLGVCDNMASVSCVCL